MVSLKNTSLCILLINALAKGLLLAEGLEHRRQRRVMNPAFGPSQIRDLTGIFISKANEVRGDLAFAPIHDLLTGGASSSEIFGVMKSTSPPMNQQPLTYFHGSRGQRSTSSVSLVSIIVSTLFPLLPTRLMSSVRPSRVCFSAKKSSAFGIRLLRSFRSFARS
jgi:cytochrome P450